MSTSLNKHGKTGIAVLLIVIAAGAAAGYYFWQKQNAAPLIEDFARGNGRIEATQIDIATKLPGRLQSIDAKEGSNVEAGQVIAQMDVQALEAQLREAQAQVRRAQNAQATAQAFVAQRMQAKRTATAIVAQRESELAFTDKQLARSQQLVDKGFNAPQKLDIDMNRKQSALAMLSAAQSQVVEAESGILAAQSQVIEAQAGIEAAKATVERLQTEIADNLIKAPRRGRLQHRLAEPGEVLGGGGKVATLIDLTDVYMTVFMPETVVGKIAIGTEARVVLDAVPQFVLPAKVSYVASQAQFTPKTVETSNERQKLVFQVRLQLDPQILQQFAAHVKAGMPGVATIHINPAAAWPQALQIALPAATAAPVATPTTPATPATAEPAPAPANSTATQAVPPNTAATPAQ